jgi:hypothetical protein
MNADSSSRSAVRPGLAWSPENFRFDELDVYSACVPYGMAHVELPAALWGKTIRVEGRLIAPGLPYKSRWEPPSQVRVF